MAQWLYVHYVIKNDCTCTRPVYTEVKYKNKMFYFQVEIMEANGIGHIVGIKIDTLLAPVRKYTRTGKTS